MQQIEGQITLNDLLTENVPLSWSDESHKGNMIPFQKLKDYIGKKVLIERSTVSLTTYNVVMITNYYENADHVWTLNERSGKYEQDYAYDKVGYSDDKRRHKKNAWVDEIDCYNGRFEPLRMCPQCFYEYRAI